MNVCFDALDKKEKGVGESRTRFRDNAYTLRYSCKG